MKNIFRKNKNQKGYAILFTVVIVSAISVITAGLTNATYKQLILSSLAKDSQVAFYQADTAGDCALYADWVGPKNDPNFLTTQHGWTCGGASLTVKDIKANGYKIYPTNEDVSTPCFRIDVIKDISAPPLIRTTISAKGYNICNTTNLRTVERKIEIKYDY